MVVDLKKTNGTGHKKAHPSHVFKFRRDAVHIHNNTIFKQKVNIIILKELK